MHILVVDDDPDIRRLAALSLRRIGGFEISLAAGGDEAIALAIQSRPDLVLLDVTMPGLDGPATLRGLRSHEATAHVPVVFFTAASYEGDAARLRALGALGVLPKPFDVSELPRLVLAYVGEVGVYPSNGGSAASGASLADTRGQHE